MGRGDKRSTRGKISSGSFGKTRNRKKIKARLAKAAATVIANKKKKTSTKKK
jgi:ribosomal small subunit protein bTHX